MNPNVWGPSLWDLLFYISFNIDLSEHCADIQHLFQLLEVILPCSQCRRHYALYRKEVPPTTIINKRVKESAAQWLWTIHDMVNQNLGKICMDYDSLVKKHNSLTCIVHDLTIFDIFMFIWFSSKNKKKLCEGINLMLKLLRNISSLNICKVFVNDTTENWDMADMLNKKNILLRHHHNKEQTMQDFLTQYSHAIA
tara:strand:- start:7642 stop:8229 length:588 start_codon:yes stop_codon:yes gene_type:complete